MRPNASYLDRLIKHYGVTDEPLLGGFLLPDGLFLDFSEGSGSRAQDHRNITWVLPRGWEQPHMSRWDGLVKLCQHIGMYRWMPESWQVETWTPPTREQMRVVNTLAREPLRDRRGRFFLTIEMQDPRRRMAFGQQRSFSCTYPPYDAAKAVEELRAFYEGAELVCDYESMYE